MKQTETVQGYEVVESTPFAIVTIGDKRAIAIGNQRVSSKEFETAEEAKQYISAKPYDLIINLTIWVAQNFEKFNNINEEEINNE